MMVTDKGLMEQLADLARRGVAGLKSQVMARDPETGEMVEPFTHNIKRALDSDMAQHDGRHVSPQVHSGIIDEVQSLPTLLRDLGPLAATGMDKLGYALSGQKHYDNMEPEGDQGQLLTEFFTAPTWAEEAEERAGKNLAASRKSMGVGEPHGFLQNAAESGGVMFGQLPVPGAVLKKLKLLKAGAEAQHLSKMGKFMETAKKAAGSGVEYLSPTIDPSVSNYAAGTMFGGTAGAISDYLNAGAAEPDDAQ